MFELKQVHWPHRISVEYLTLQAGEMVALIGPNGAGKSSLLRLLAGLNSPPQGQVHLNDRPLSHYTPAQQAELRAFLPQNITLNTPLTVSALLTLGTLPGNPIHSSRKEEILTLLQLSPLLTRQLHTLSGGEQQRAQLARVLLQVWGHPASYPRTLLLDESLNSLDIRYQQVLLHWLRQKCEQKALAVVWACHDLTQALHFSHRGWLVAHNMLHAAAPLTHMAENGQLSRAFDWPLQLYPCEKTTAILPAQAIPSD